MRGIPRMRRRVVAQALPVDVPEHRRTLGAARPVVAGFIVTRWERGAIGLRAGQRVVLVGGVSAAVDDIPLLGQRRLLVDVVVAMQFVEIFGDDHTLDVLPWPLADAVAGVDR